VGDAGRASSPSGPSGHANCRLELLEELTRNKKPEKARQAAFEPLYALAVAARRAGRRHPAAARAAGSDQRRTQGGTLACCRLLCWRMARLGIVLAYPHRRSFHCARTSQLRPIDGSTHRAIL
jgi:hypothetical protein